jgi:hypothetical protein
MIATQFYRHPNSRMDFSLDITDPAPLPPLRLPRVPPELPQIAVQTTDAARLVGIGADVFRKIPWRVLPYARHGKHRWYLVRHVQHFAESLMAMRMARGEPRHMESLLALIHDMPPMEATDGHP